MITQSLLKEALHYDEATGVFTWMAARGRASAGHVAGTTCLNGYIRIKVYGRVLFAHRLAWLYVHGEFPPDQLDHINHNKSDNRLSNLRPATRAQNQKNRFANSNSTSGRKGVVWSKKAGLWRSVACLNGKKHHLGYFHDPEAASAAYQEFARKHHGEFYYQPGAQK